MVDILKCMLLSIEGAVLGSLLVLGICSTLLKLIGRTLPMLKLTSTLVVVLSSVAFLFAFAYIYYNMYNVAFDDVQEEIAKEEHNLIARQAMNNMEDSRTLENEYRICITNTPIFGEQR